LTVTCPVCLLTVTYLECPAGRQFKEASRFAGLVKTAMAEVSEEEERLHTYEVAMKTASERLAILGQELSACQDRVAQLERSEGKGLPLWWVWSDLGVT